MTEEQNSMQTLENILGKHIIKNNGDEISTVSLSSKKQILLYFSAHWCPPCRGFTPVLSNAYNGYMEKIGEESSEVEVVFISRDKDAEAFADYHKDMSFPALPFNKDHLDKLAKDFGVQGIPSLVAIDGSNGEKLESSVDFRSLISTHGVEAFPLTPERVNALEAEEKVKEAQILKDLYGGRIPFPIVTKEVEAELSMEEIMSKFEHIAIILGDGDHTDACYDDVRDTVDKVNTGDGIRLAVIYMGWSLYNENSDHNKVSEKFDFALNEIPKDLKDAVGTIVGKENACAPTLVVLRRGTGLCTIDGKCDEESDTLAVVSVDPGIQKIRTTGEKSYPWDEVAMKAFEEQQKLKIERLKSSFTDMRFLTDPEGEEDIIILQEDGDVPLKERLFVGDGEGVVGVYFSAHWCPPCQRFTPKLVECYEKLKAMGKKFEVVFVSSDSSKEEFDSYYSSMQTSTGDQFLALDFEKRDYKNILSEVFHVRGIPSLILMKSDGTVISNDGVSSIYEGGTNAFPWDEDTVKRVAAEELKKLLENEQNDEETQRASGGAIIKRIAGMPGKVKHDIDAKIFTFELFSTVGAPGMCAESGVVYYELEILKSGGYPQFGFAQKDSIEQADEYVNSGVGDNETSWGVDGCRSCKWHGDSEDDSWKGTWTDGNVIGLAANLDKGMIAVSKDGNWEQDGFGLVFQNASIKDGVYPCFTGSTGQVRYCFDTNSLKHGPPDDSLWNN